MRRPAMIALAVLTAMPAAACRDLVSNENTSFFEGSFDAHDMIPSASGNDLIAEGWQVGIAFVLDVYLIVGMPPVHEFAEPQITLGGFEPDQEQQLNFLDEERAPFETGAYTVEGPQGNETVQFDFDEGKLGFLQMRTTATVLGGLTTLGGTYNATEFVLANEDGDTFDLLEDPDSEIFMGVGLQDDWPAWGTYQMSLDVPAGVLTEEGLSVTYPEDFPNDAENFLSVGPSVAFFGLLGCDVFAGRDVLLSSAIVFQGYACDLDGESYMVNARFEAS